MLLQYHQYFCTEEMAYRGHDETSESSNAGKWKEFITLMLRTNPLFKTLHGKMKHQYRTYDYTSKRSCNELVKVMSFEARRTIKEKIDKAGMYSLLIDECKDNAGDEELAICFRFLNALGEIEERFYELARLKKADAATIVNVGIFPTFERMNAAVSLLAVGADGASVMGVMKELLAHQYPWLIYIHCAAHRLNLIIATYLGQVKAADDVIKTYKALHNIFNVAKHK